MSKSSVFAAALVAVLAAGCSNGESPATASQDTATPQPNPVVAAPKVEATAPVAGVEFTVSPSEFRKCDAAKGRIVASVKWDVTAAGVGYVNVLVDNGSGTPTLFTSGKATGERSTGNWVVDGTRFILQNAANKQQLAVSAVSAKDC